MEMMPDGNVVVNNLEFAGAPFLTSDPRPGMGIERTLDDRPPVVGCEHVEGAISPQEQLPGNGGCEADRDDGSSMPMMDVASEPKKAMGPPQITSMPSTQHIAVVLEAPGPEIRLSPETAVKLHLLLAYFFVRTDKIAVVAPWGRACPASLHEQWPLPAVLRGHVEGKTSPEVRFKSKEGSVKWLPGPHRVGSYCPDPNGTVSWLGVDFDGGAAHKFALKDPLRSALDTLDNLKSLGLTGHLERSGGGSGWHVWVFFDEPIPAALARQLGQHVVPLDAALAKGGIADPKAGKGIEIFPKQDQIAEDGVGNLLWLPWWHGAPEGANEFYRVEPDGQLQRYLPEKLETVSRSCVEAIVGEAAIIPARNPLVERAALSNRNPHGMHIERLDDPKSNARKMDAHALLEHLMTLPVMQWATENPQDVSRECWRGLATNIAAAVLEDPDAHEDGEQAFQDLSAADPDRYDEGSTRRMFADALKSAVQPGPMVYQTLAANGLPDHIALAGQGDGKNPIVHARRTLARAAQPPKAQPLSGSSSTPTIPGTANPANTPDGGDVFNEDDWLYDRTQGFFKRDNLGSWDVDVPMKSDPFKLHLLKCGIHPKALAATMCRVRAFNVRAPIYGSSEVYLERDGIPVFNTYRPPTIEPTAAPWPDIKAVLMNLVNQDPEGYEYLLDWLAAPLQSLREHRKPRKMGTAIVLRGKEGAGKGLLMLLLRECYGAANVMTIGQNSIDGRFNGELTNKLFVVANEVMSGSNRSLETANKIKPWVTDPFIPIEAKFGATGLVENNFNIIITSNDPRPVIIPKDDRRYSVFVSGVLDPACGARAYDDVVGAKTQVEGFYAHLLERKVSIAYGKLYQTDERKTLMEASSHSHEKFVEAIKSDGWLAVAAPWIKDGIIRDSDPTNRREATVQTSDGKEWVLSATLMEVYLDYHRRNGLTGKAKGDEDLMTELRKALKVEKASRPYIGGVQQRAYSGIPLQGNAAENGVSDAKEVDELEQARMKKEAAAAAALADEELQAGPQA